MSTVVTIRTVLTSRHHHFSSFAALFLALAAPPRLHAQTAGSLDPAFNPNFIGIITGTAVQADGKILLVGSANLTSDDFHGKGIARLLPDGTVESTTTFMRLNSGIDESYVYSVAVQVDGKILLGGTFNSVNGQPRSRIARLNADGTVESTTTFNPGTGVAGGVFSVAIQADGKILLGGTFTSVNGQPRNNIARLLPDGTVESTATFNPGTGANSIVNSIAIQADGKILLGGYFTSVNGQTRNRIARLLPDGTVESTATFNPGTGVDPASSAGSYAVNSVAMQADGKILLVGYFTNINGQPRNGIARLNADGTLEMFNPGTIASNNAVKSVAIQADGKILLGGGFTSVNGQPRNGIARLLPDGTVESIATFNPGTGVNPGTSANSVVNSVAIQADGKILLGGNFTSVDGQTRNRIARLSNDAASQSLTIPSNSRVQWARGGAAPEVEQVTFEFSTNGGVNWNPLGTATRITGGWELTGLSLPANSSIRARGRTIGGQNNASSGVVEQTLNVPEIAVERVRDGKVTE